MLPDEEVSVLIAVLSFLALDHRWPREVHAKDRVKWAGVEGPPWEQWLVVFYKN